MARRVDKIGIRTRRILGSDDGQGLVEYALILVLIAVIVIAAVKAVGSSTSSTFTNINTNMTNP